MLILKLNRLRKKNIPTRYLARAPTMWHTARNAMPNVQKSPGASFQKKSNHQSLCSAKTVVAKVEDVVVKKFKN